MLGATKTRAAFIGFASDGASADLLQAAFAPALHAGNEIHVVPFRIALDLLGAMTTPEVVLIDLSGESQPINAMLDLAEVVEPGTVVLAIGESRDVGFYRAITKGMGVREYLPKPLTTAKTAEAFPQLGKTGTGSRCPDYARKRGDYTGWPADYIGWCARRRWDLNARRQSCMGNRHGNAPAYGIAGC